MTREQLLDSFIQFVATEEGFFVPNSRAARQRNPGNLVSWGRNPVADGYVVFPTLEAGWDALRRQAAKNIFDRKLTFRTFFAGERDIAGVVIKGGYSGYCPAPTGSRMTTGNDPTRYALDAVAWVNHKLGAAADLDTVIRNLVG